MVFTIHISECNVNPVTYNACFLQAIAIVLGFIVFIGLIILIVFAVKTRSKIRHWGPERILWEEVKVITDGPHNSVGEWVSVCLSAVYLYGFTF